MAKKPSTKTAPPVTADPVAPEVAVDAVVELATDPIDVIESASEPKEEATELTLAKELHAILKRIPTEQEHSDHLIAARDRMGQVVELLTARKAFIG
jgi:hypothetical protein